jgi:hypothetical protein
MRFRRTGINNRMDLKILNVFLMLFIYGITCIFSQSTEAELKAVAFQKLSLFIDWPGNVFNNNEKDFIIGVLGKNPFDNKLEDIYKNVRIKDRPVRIEYFRDIRQLKKCHLLFISRINETELKQILVKVDTLPVLTISDTEGFAEAGCFVNFYDYSGKLRFEINQKAMESAGFKVDYKLLSVSKIVNPVNK